MLLRWLLSGLLVALAFPVFAQAADDAYIDEPTTSILEVTTGAVIKQRITQGWRPTTFAWRPGQNLLVHPVFAVSYVRNAGAHTRNALFESGITADTLELRRLAGWRIVSIEIYPTAFGKRYAGLFFKDARSANTNRYFENLTYVELVQALAQFRGRVIELDLVQLPQGSTAPQRFNGVMTKNEGASFLAAGVAVESDSRTLLETRRASDLAIRYDNSFVKYSFPHVPLLGQQRLTDEVESISGTQARNLEDGTRIDRLKYLPSNPNFIVTLRVNNRDAVTNRLHLIVAPAVSAQPFVYSRFGLYLRQVGGPVLVDHQSEKPFFGNPANMVLAHLHAVTFHSVNAFPTTRIGGPNGPLVRDVLRASMVGNDLAAADALLTNYGMNSIISSARAIGGVSNLTTLISPYRSTAPYGPVPRNQTTLKDLGILYQRVGDGLLGTVRTAYFRDNMLTDRNGSPFGPIIQSVRTELGLTTTQYNSWRARTTWMFKGGGTPRPNTQDTRFYAMAGQISLPFRSGTTHTNRRYVFGLWVQDANKTFNGIQTGSPAEYPTGELVRGIVRDSMRTYR